MVNPTKVIVEFDNDTGVEFEDTAGFGCPDVGNYYLGGDGLLYQASDPYECDAVLILEPKKERRRKL